MVVTVSGLPGSGTSTLSARAAAALGLEHLDGGTVFRAMAQERGLSVGAFSALAEGDPAYDLELDRRLAEVARRGGVLLESRLAGWIVANEGVAAVRVWVACDEHERAARVAAREGIDAVAALAQNRQRETSERHRYQAYYGIDLTDLGVYDLCLDSTAASPEELLAALVAFVAPT